MFSDENAGDYWVYTDRAERQSSAPDSLRETMH
jgi:hypothetical protein